MADRRRSAIVLLVAALAACGGAAAHPSDATAVAGARAAATAFLDHYVQPDGRVARTDQGGDTVSEGQSYGLLLAEVAGDSREVGLIWSWTREHLQRPDGLLAYHATPDGRVLDRSAATDADLVTAWALVRAREASLRDDGRRLAAAVLDHETVRLPDGRLLLAAGDWATGHPATLDPSYWAFPAMKALAADAPDGRWGQLASSTGRTLDDLTGGGRTLPPDWARVDAAGVSATPSPNGTEPDVRYSFDGQRCLVWMAAAPGSPSPAHETGLLDAPGRATAQALSPTGAVINGDDSAVAAVAAAAAESAAGHPAQRDRLLAAADAIVARAPTYYGSAWDALGRALLTTTLLTGAGS
jgi:endoglucanase